MQFVPELGKLVEGEARRDAIHVAVAPVVAGEELKPGDKVLLRDGQAFKAAANPIGIVDPYLWQLIPKGRRFWLCLYPNTVTSLRHVWTHPAFQAKAPETTNRVPTQEFLSA